MHELLAAADAVVLVSIYKPILMLIVFGVWGRIVATLDKDLLNLFLARQLWNGMQMAAGVLALLLWLVIPWFWVGGLLALVVLAGPIAGYVQFRNTKVDPEHRWRFSLDMLTQRLQMAQNKQAQRQAFLHLLRPDLSRFEVPAGQDPRVAPHQKFEDLMDWALPRKADRLDVVIGANQQVAVVVHVDGFKYPQEAPDAKLALALMDYLKQHAGLDVEERRRKQTGTLHIDAGPHGRHTLVLTAAGSTRDLSLVVRVDADLKANVGLDKLGLLAAQKQQLLPVVKDHGRVMLVAGPAHQGLTTTLYSLMHEHDPYIQSVVTFEDEVAFEVEGINHTLVEPGTDAAGQTQKLEALLRQDPQVVMVSRLADGSMARLMARSATEIRFYTALPQEDTFAALKLWIRAVGDPKLAAESLAGIVAQRLLRKLCTTCRSPYKPDPAALRKLNLPAERDTTLYKQSGQVLVKDKPQPCPQCLGLAYRGRVAVFEVMVLDTQARQLIAKQDLDQLRVHLRKNKMLYLQEAALARVVDGTTSIAEITRVLSGK